MCQSTSYQLGRGKWSETELIHQKHLFHFKPQPSVHWWCILTLLEVPLKLTVLTFPDPACCCNTQRSKSTMLE